MRQPGKKKRIRPHRERNQIILMAPETMPVKENAFHSSGERRKRTGRLRERRMRKN